MEGVLFRAINIKALPMIATGTIRVLRTQFMMIIGSGGETFSIIALKSVGFNKNSSCFQCSPHASPLMQISLANKC